MAGQRQRGLAAPNLPANLISVLFRSCRGFSVQIHLSANDLDFFFKFVDEYRALTRPQWRTIVFGGRGRCIPRKHRMQVAIHDYRCDPNPQTSRNI